MFAMMLVTIIGFTGMALDLAQLYNRKAELQNIADSAALAAAQGLNGTAAGVTAAVAQASAIVLASRYQYQGVPSWSDAALSFSADAAAPGAVWVNAAAAQAAPAALHYARVDTAQLGPAALGSVATVFAAVLGSELATATVSARAVARRTSVPVTPLAICAMSATATGARTNAGIPQTELVEYGFRRGVGYNLLNLNPNGTAPAYYLVDPIDIPGTPGAVANTADAVVAPFMCSGSLPQARVTGQAFTLRQPAVFNLAPQLNSRFNSYTAPSNCTPAGAPPDLNIQAYAGAQAGWMTPVPSRQTALAVIGASSLTTVADRTSPASAAADYGVLWSFARPAPSAQGTAFTKAQWTSLYTATGGPPVAGATLSASGIPSPYTSTSGAYFAAPAQPGRRNRRVLNIPLLQCPVAGGQATVLAVGQFLLTAPASAAGVSAEFGGIVNEQALGGVVELVQ